MNQNIIESIVITAWLLIAVYDVVFGFSETLYIIIFTGWLLTMFYSLKWGKNIISNKYVKVAALFVVAFVVFIVFGFAIEIIAEISPRFEHRYENIILAFVQSIIASVITAIFVALPIVSVYKERLIFAILIVTLPIAIFQIDSMINSENLATQLILGFDIIFVVLIVWLVCLLVHRPLFNESAENITSQ